MLKKIDTFLLKQAQRLSDLFGDRWGISHLRLAVYFAVSALFVEVILALAIGMLSPELLPVFTVITLLAGLTTLKRVRAFEGLKDSQNTEEYFTKAREIICNNRTSAVMVSMGTIILGCVLYYYHPEVFRVLPVVLGGIMIISDVILSGIGYYIVSCKPPIAEEV